MSKQTTTGRRSILTASGLAIATIGFSGVSKADNQPVAGFVVEEGELKLYQDEDNAYHSEDAIRKEIERAVQELNSLAAKGYIDFRQDDENTWIELTDKGERKFNPGINSTIQPEHHGENGYNIRTPGLFRPYYRYDLLFDDDNSDELSTRLLQSGAIGGVTAFIMAKTGIGMLPAGVVAVLSVAAVVIAEEIDLQNDGHGVEVRIYDIPTFITPGPNWTSVNGQ